MPELPEVETLRRGLAEHLVGQRIRSIELRQPRLVAAGDLETLVGATVCGVRRRAKHLLIETDRGALLVHLKLAGQIVLRDPQGRTLASGGHPVPPFDAPLPHRSTHLLATLESGAVLYLTDIRHFGRVWLLPLEEAEARLARLGLGPEPLSEEFTVEVLAAALRGRRRPLKQALLDQTRVAGLGNIYTDEALWRASLAPSRPAGDLGTEELARLRQAIQAVLWRAVTEGVAQVLDGRAAAGTDFPAVHGREGQPCPRCGTAIVKTRLGGRGTYSCPACQPLAQETAASRSSAE